MRAFLATLFGDLRNSGVVAVLIAVEIAMVEGGLARAAAIAVPVVTLASIGWLARPTR